VPQNDTCNIDMKRQQYFDLLILLFILVIGGVLRFYNFSNIPMTHDELSAIQRLNYDTFSELIEKGVKNDGHPAGVQVFLFYWTKYLGNSDSIIKFPFLLLGLGSIVLAYIISKKWFNSTTSLLVAAYIASLQFPVMYSQIARPYISGLFFCLLMVMFWTQYLFEDKYKRLANLTGFVLSAAVCCYNHHFSLLFTIIVGVTGLFYLRQKKGIPYFISLIAVFVLYIPHLNIFFYQLNNEGLNWLGKPSNSFIIDHIKYIFHFNALIYLSVITLTFIGLYRNKDSFKSISKFQIISIIWFSTPILVGFFYSIYFKPVIQYSMLIFSFPYLLFFLFSFYKPVSQIFKIVSVTIVLLFNIMTLVWTRQHYRIFYKQPFKEYALLTNSFLQIRNPKDVTIIFNENPDYIDHYFSEYNPGITYISTFDKTLGPVEFRKKIASESTEYLISGGIPLEKVSIAKEYYPYLVDMDFGFTYEFYIFSKRSESTNEDLKKDILFSNKMDFSKEKENWHNIHNSIRLDSSLQGICSLDSVKVWGPTFKIALTDITNSRHNIIDIGINFKNGEKKLGHIVCEILKDGESFHWRSSSIDKFCDLTLINEWQRAYLSLRLTGVFAKEGDMQDCILKIYYWNSNRECIYLDDFVVQVREGNNRVYSLIENID